MTMSAAHNMTAYSYKSDKAVPAFNDSQPIIVFDGKFHFHVDLRLPIIGRIVKYVGWFDPQPK